jgi:very-short-patch-repair endonuclease
MRRASTDGSALEKYLLKELLKKKYKIIYHKEHMLRNIYLHIDLFIQSLSTAIEIDGPSHFEPIWGEERLKKVQAADKQKTGLILSEGLCLVRIQQKQSSITQRYQREVLKNLVSVLSEIEKKFPPEYKRLFLI